ncbi:hypothetical protein RN001_013972 [Aquatica leii]|uniref:Uncharacterized protein n=1 Tax=Aquatica leii TaxID=1421715 RepID=A0AAN7PSF5_9COLE|nr:hypothetical protein RN001_013972 [Aquatica leii]
MSAVPQGAFMMKKYRENQQRNSKEQIPFFNDNMELNPLKYNSKMMNSIWGLYNRYSVHNLKNKNACADVLNQQIQSVGAASTGSKNSAQYWNPLEKLQSVLGYHH